MSRNLVLLTVCITLTLALSAPCQAADKNSPSYLKATVKLDPAAKEKVCEIQGPTESYRIGNCDEFQNGQAVEFRVKEHDIYVRSENGKERKREILATLKPQVDEEKKAPTYQKGVIVGYETRKDLHRMIFQPGSDNHPTLPMGRRSKVYELRGVDKVYSIDMCGAFQAGKFEPGQEVEYRVNAERLFIRHDGDKEYSCQIQGMRMLDDAKSEIDSKAASKPAQ